MTQQRILLADDEPRLLHVVGLYLSMEGFEVREASDGTEALSMLETEEFDLAILDVMMPGVDGIEVCRHIRSQPGTQSMPVLVFTSLSSDKDVERARLANARLGALADRAEAVAFVEITDEGERVYRNNNRRKPEDPNLVEPKRGLCKAEPPEGEWERNRAGKQDTPKEALVCYPTVHAAPPDKLLRKEVSDCLRNEE